MDPIKTIGQVLTGGEQRDAIHIAIMPVVAGENLRPGDEVGLVYGTRNVVKQRGRAYGLKSIGVIDPFLACHDSLWNIKTGQTVWCFLHPGSITSLRHEWTQPDIDKVEAPVGEAEKWLRTFADEWNFDYDTLISEAMAGSTSHFEHFITANGKDLHDRGELGADHDRFWFHLERLTGRTFDAGHKDRFGWSCSC